MKNFKSSGTKARKSAIRREKKGRKNAQERGRRPSDRGSRGETRAVNFQRDKNERRERDNNPNYGNERRSSKPSMHKAVCQKCRQDCQVPFRPNGKKPILCSTCFGKKESMSKPKRESRPAPTATCDNSEVLRQLNMLHTKLDELLNNFAEIDAEIMEEGDFDEEEFSEKSPEDVPEDILEYGREKTE